MRRALRIAGAALLLVAAAQLPVSAAQAQERSAEELLREIRARGNEAPLALFDQLGALKSPEALEALEKATAAVTGIARVHAAQQAFRHFAGDGELAARAAEFLAERAEHRDRRLALHAVWQLGELGPAAGPTLIGLALRSDAAEAREIATVRLEDLGLPLDVGELKKLARDEVDSIRFVARRALVERDEDAPRPALLARSRDAVEQLIACDLAAAARPAEVPTLVTLLAAEDARVRRAAVDGLGTSRDARAVAALIDMLAQAPEDARPRVVAALRRLTGLELGRSPERWRRWWSEEGDTFVPPEAAPEDEPAPPPPSATRSGFYGLPLVSNRLVFAVDASDSMKAKVPDTTGETRLDVAKEELTRALEALPDDALFDLVHFGRGADAWRGELVEMSRRTRGRALEHVAGLGTSFGTDVYSPLRLSLLDPRVDTVVLLTDGDPYFGPINGVGALRRLVAFWNATRRAAIDCVAIGQDRAWMRELATDTGGRYLRADG